MSDFLKCSITLTLLLLCWKGVSNFDTLRAFPFWGRFYGSCSELQPLSLRVEPVRMVRGGGVLASPCQHKAWAAIYDLKHDGVKQELNTIMVKVRGLRWVLLEKEKSLLTTALLLVAIETSICLYIGLEI